MAADSRRNAPADRAEAGPLLSHSSILILSGFLIGMVARHLVDPRWEPLVYMLGLFGLVAWLALGHIARCRDERKSKNATEQAATRLASRLDRHMLKFQAASPLSRRIPRPRIEQQYLPVGGFRSSTGTMTRAIPFRLW